MHPNGTGAQYHPSSIRPLSRWLTVTKALSAMLPSVLYRPPLSEPCQRRITGVQQMVLSLPSSSSKGIQHIPVCHTLSLAAMRPYRTERRKLAKASHSFSSGTHAQFRRGRQHNLTNDTDVIENPFVDALPSSSLLPLFFTADYAVVEVAPFSAAKARSN